MRILRWFLIGIVALIGGALVNEAVIRIPLSRAQSSSDLFSTPVHVRGWPMSVPSHWPPADAAQTKAEKGIAFERWVARAIDADHSYYAAQSIWAGWPLRALVAEDSVEEHPLMPASIDPMSIIRMPNKPLWAGLLANSALFGCVLWLLAVAGDRFTRYQIRSFRLRRHLCPSCGYPRGTSSICTECGVRHRPLAI